MANCKTASELCIVSQGICQQREKVNNTFGWPPARHKSRRRGIPHPHPMALFHRPKKGKLSTKELAQIYFNASRRPKATTAAKTLSQDTKKPSGKGCGRSLFVETMSVSCSRFFLSLSFPRSLPSLLPFIPAKRKEKHIISKVFGEEGSGNLCYFTKWLRTKNA